MTQKLKNEFNFEKWLEKARDDELCCRSLLKHKDAAPGPGCFWAQQMAEKLLKALLVFHKKEYPKIHDLKRLATILEPLVPDIFDIEEPLNVLNKYYALTRYPADFPEGFSWQDAEKAFEAATRVKKFISRKLTTNP